MDTLLIVGLVLAAVMIVLVLVGLAVGILGRAVLVAGNLFAWASEQGFVGVAVYIACWVFMFPVMVIICLCGAVLVWLVERQQQHDAIDAHTKEEANNWKEQDVRYEEARAKLLARQKEREEEPL